MNKRYVRIAGRPAWVQDWGAFDESTGLTTYVLNIECLIEDAEVIYRQDPLRVYLRVGAYEFNGLIQKRRLGMRIDNGAMRVEMEASYRAMNPVSVPEKWQAPKRALRSVDDKKPATNQDISQQLSMLKTIKHSYASTEIGEAFIDGMVAALEWVQDIGDISSPDFLAQFPSSISIEARLIRPAD